MLSINYFMPARIAARNLNIANEKLTLSTQKLTTGKRINSAADDPAGLGIAKRLTAKIDSLSTSYNNTQDGISLLSVAEGALVQMSSILQRMYSLANQAANGTLSTSDRQLLQVEVNQLVSEIDRISTATEYNAVQLLTGNFAAGKGSIIIQVGPGSMDKFSFNLGTASSSSLYVHSIDITTEAAANTAMSLIQSGINRLSSLSANTGSLMNRLTYASENGQTLQLNYMNALSNVEDTDFALEMMEYLKNQMLSQASSSFLAQANLQYESLFDLLKSLSSS